MNRWADMHGETPTGPFERGEPPQGETIACPDCVDGLRYERRGVDVYVAVGICATCGGWEKVSEG